MSEAAKRFLSLIIVSAFCAVNVQASSFSEIELIETNEIEEIDFSFCFNEHYNDINIRYIEAHQITQCFIDGSQQLLQLYCHSNAAHLLNDLISGLEYSLSWLNILEHYPQTELLTVNKQQQKIKELIYLTAKESPMLCTEYKP